MTVLTKMNVTEANNLNEDRMLEELIYCSKTCSAPVSISKGALNIEIGLPNLDKMCLIERNCPAKTYLQGIPYCDPSNYVGRD